MNVRFNGSQSGETVLADLRRTLDAVRAADPEFEYEIEFPPARSRGLGRLAKAAVDVPVPEPIVQMVRANLKRVSGREPEHLGVRLPQSYAGNNTTRLWQAGIPCCLYGPGGGYTDYHDVHTDLGELFPGHARPRAHGARGDHLRRLEDGHGFRATRERRDQPAIW